MTLIGLVNTIFSSVETVTNSYVYGQLYEAGVYLIAGLAAVIWGSYRYRKLPSARARRQTKIEKQRNNAAWHIEAANKKAKAIQQANAWQPMYKIMLDGPFKALAADKPVQKPDIKGKDAAFENAINRLDYKTKISTYEKIVTRALKDAVSVTRNGTVDTYRFRVPILHEEKHIIALAPAIQAAYGYHSHSVRPITEPGYVSISFSKEDIALAKLAGEDAPVLHLTPTQQNDPYLWLPVGVKIPTGDSFDMPLFLRGQGSVREIVGGISGSGKSSIFLEKLLFATKCPHINVDLMDGKGSEFWMFADFVKTYAVGPGTKEFFRWLADWEADVAERTVTLAHNRAHPPIGGRFDKNWNPYDDGPFKLKALDEPAVIYLGHRDAPEIMDRLYAVASVSRSLGIGMMFSSQSWSHEIITRMIRDQCFDLRTGFEYLNPADSEMLGFRIVAGDESPAPHKIKGVLTRENGRSTAGTFATSGLENEFGKSFYLSDDVVFADLKNWFGK